MLHVIESAGILIDRVSPPAGGLCSSLDRREPVDLFAGKRGKLCGKAASTDLSDPAEIRSEISRAA